MTTRRPVSVLEFCRELFEWDGFNEVCVHACVRACVCMYVYVSVCTSMVKVSR